MLYKDTIVMAILTRICVDRVLLSHKGGTGNKRIILAVLKRIGVGWVLVSC